MVAIKSIKEIKNFASFENFDASISPYKNFQKYNIFYGLNGSGKTTLSRLLSFLNVGKIPDDEESKEQYQDFNQLKFKIELDNDDIVTVFDNNQLINKIRVFNSDFVSRNVKLEKATTKSLIYNISEKSDKLKTKRKYYEKNISYWHNKDNQLIIDKNIEEKDKILQNKYQDLAREIKYLLNLSNSFNKNSVKDLFNQLTQCKELSDEEFQKFVAISKQDEKYLLDINFDNLSVNSLKKDEFDELKKILLTKKTRNTGEKETVINWISDGLKIHQNDHTKCKFCSQEIHHDFWKTRLSEIEQILKKDIEFETFEQNIRQIINRLDNKIRFIDTFDVNITSNQFLIQYQKQAELILCKIKELKSQSRQSLEIIKSLFEKKLFQLDEAIVLEDSVFDLSYFSECKKLNLLIQSNNIECNELSKIKEDAKNKIISSILFPHMGEVARIKSYLAKANTTKVMIADRISNYQIKLATIIKELNNQKVAINEIENICEQIFGYKKFSFTFDENLKSYKITRTGKTSARNISEGEQTVIAFAYFIACLKEGNFNREEGIVVIDDPVSSLDQQYLFNIYVVLMREVLKENLCSQAFILTHNFYFFRKVRNCLKNISKLKDETKKQTYENTYVSVYSIEKTNGKSVIKDASKYLLNYETEYLHLIRKLNKDLVEADNEFSDVGVGNAIRQVLEIFLSFKCPDKNNLFTRFQNVTPKPDKKFKYLYDLVNSMSHTDEIDTEVVNGAYKRIAGKSDIQELFDFIKEIDAEHYEKIKKIV